MNRRPDILIILFIAVLAVPAFGATNEVKSGTPSAIPAKPTAGEMPLQTISTVPPKPQSMVVESPMKGEPPIISSGNMPSAVTGPAPSIPDGQAQMAIKGYRFQKHKQFEFERLVFEFKKKAKGKTAPKVTTSAPLEGGGTNLVEVRNAALTGVIPNEFGNDFVRKRSIYLAAFTLYGDPASGISVKLALADPRAKVDAFWLEGPSRLVIDLFLKSSPRAEGLAILRGAAAVAVAKEPAETKHAPKGTIQEEIQEVMSKTRKAWNAKRYRKDFFCFPASAEVTASLEYQKKITDRISAEGDFPAVKASDYVVCYPKTAQVMPRIEFFSVFGESQLSELSESASHIDLRVPSSDPSVDDIPIMSTGTSAPAAPTALPNTAKTTSQVEE